MFTREEFAQRLEASRREENRLATIWLVGFFAVLLVNVVLFRWAHVAGLNWLTTVLIVEILALIASQVWLLLHYVKNRTKRFGLVCPGCGTPLSGQAGYIVLDRGSCVLCKTQLFEE